MKAILFSSTTCPVCPKAERIAREVLPDYYENGLSYTKYNARKGEGQTLAAQYYVMGTPSLLFLDDEGNEIKRIVGVPSEKALRASVEKALGMRESFISKLFKRNS